MRAYELTLSAKNDLREIIQYTVETWGKAQADKYVSSLEECFFELSDPDLFCRQIFKGVYVIPCNHHYIFFIKEEPIIVIAILHEKMDLMKRLKKRLET